ncbi:30S ribosomal protein S5 [Candidatus Kaiserbacteria bacterium RIFCSPLOWO2_12_FULL_50_28]|uniref:Small ribosomal subunit protein uS5 n=1 Tax=Candidatus Kaiserbacteria bacterium RIFCSPLOWO2_12_FULL_50_28 TaxID=1798527 RepID=A0A1F6FQ27_9BACT|nr:MAG: 30S ribosomal protein S5 [Candidatus Kaiserbacteria bacterium RIFCSPLOWO2_12_FULL_50_28]
MSEFTAKKEEIIAVPGEETASVSMEESSADSSSSSKQDVRPARGRRGAPQRGRGGTRRTPRGGRDGARSEFDQKLIGIRRVARVMAGGRRFNFSVAMVLGDKKGRVGVGLGKASDTALAIEKAMRDAKRNMLTLELTKSNSIKHDVEAKYCASVVAIRPSSGSGLVAGSSVRAVLELGGVTDVTAKLLSRSKNAINNARAAVEALRKISKRPTASTNK